MTKCSTKKLYLRNNNRSCIIKDIKHVKFTDLKYISLGKNRIVSIEPLLETNLPNLEDLSVSGNEITSSKPVKIFSKLYNIGFSKLFAK